MKITANGIQIEVDDTGKPGDTQPVVLLIMGLGMQLIAWPPGFVRGLADAGFRVIRFDNRDIGLSQFFDHLGKPALVWTAIKQRLGCTIKPPYTLADMAKDSVGVLDALGVKQAHVVGASMGGMIAQHVAASHPERTLSLTSIMSSSGAPKLPAADPKLLRVMLSRPSGGPSATSSAEMEAYLLKMLSLLSGPGYPADEALRRAAIRAGLARSDHPVGTVRQMVAIAADTERHQLLARIASPTLVIHGTADPLVPMACGQDTAKRIPGARFESITGWGHDLPTAVIPLVVEKIVTHVRAHAA